MKTTPSKKTRAKYRRYLNELDLVIRSSKQVSPYTLAKDLEVSNFLPTALRKLNFIVKRGTSSGYFWVWNVKNVTHDQIIDAVIEARTRYTSNQKTKEVEQIKNKALKDITKEDLDLWRKQYKNQTPEVSDIPIRTEIYESATAGDINYSQYDEYETYNVPPTKNRALNRLILGKILSAGLDILKNLIFKKSK